MVDDIHVTTSIRALIALFRFKLLPVPQTAYAPGMAQGLQVCGEFFFEGLRINSPLVMINWSMGNKSSDIRFMHMIQATWDKRVS